MAKRDHLEIIAFEGLQTLRANANNADASMDALNEVGQLIRVHGLAATLNYLIADEQLGPAADSFVKMLDRAAPITGNDCAAKLATLKTEDHRTYLLHSRLALRLADHCRAWSRAHAEKPRVEVRQRRTSQPVTGEQQHG
jgi:hypothetical protein